MREWTPAAEQCLTSFLKSVREALPPDACDPDEVVSSLAEHVTHEAELQAAQVVTLEHVERAIRIVGSPVELPTPLTKPVGTIPSQQVAAPPKGMSRTWGLVFAVFLPALAIAFEFLTGMMAEFYIDPMPSTMHFVALCCVPIGNCFLLSSLKAWPNASFRRRRFAFGVAGALSGLTGVYSLVYLPTIPLTVVALLVMGLGLLGAVPHISLYWAAKLSLRLFAVNDPNHARTAVLRRTWWAGATGVLLVVSLWGGRIVLLETGMRMSGSELASQQLGGYRLLWWLGGEAYVLDRCYDASSNLARPIAEDNLVFAGDNLDFAPAPWVASVEDARTAYHMLTGEVFTSHRRVMRFPDRFVVLGLSAQRGRRLQVDAGLGSSNVGGPVAGLYLGDSRIDATLFTGSNGKGGELLAYMEWVMTFKNETNTVQESRTLLQLPPGAVASRLTLWINGEEREAAFGARQQVINAYREVAVVRRQDPALLTTQGTDRVLLQCFPIPVRDTLKVKVGFTMPLVVREGKAYLRLPNIVEKNYDLIIGGNHQVWVESHGPMQSNHEALALEQQGSTYSLRGSVPMQQTESADLEWISTDVELIAQRFTATLGEWQAEMTVTPKSPQPATPGPVWLVVDPGRAMKGANIDWTGFLGAFPAGTEFHGVAGNNLASQFNTQDPEEMAGWIRHLDSVGGANPIAALERAWDEASAVAGSKLIWVHGPFPVARTVTSGLEQVLQRRPPVNPDGSPRFFDLQVVPGPNRVLASLGPVRGLVTVPISYDLQAGLRYFAQYGGAEELIRTYQLQEGSGINTEGADTASDHVVRLAANAQVVALLETKDLEEANRAAALAQRLRLVTPVSGAVVLERSEQYERHGLDPGENQDVIAHVPAIPEPEEWALIILAVLAACYVAWKRARLGPVGGFAA